MIYDIQQDYSNYIKSMIRRGSLQSNLRASSIGFECDRKHYYDLTERRKEVSPQLQSIFEEGKHHEKHVERQLMEMGYELNDRQKEHRLENPLITAHIEGEIRKGDGPWYPYDIKSMASWIFDKCNSAEDFLYAKTPYLRGYVAQLLTYMLAVNPAKEFGCLILKNKQTGWIKAVWFSFEEHISILDEAIKRAERVYAARESKQPPQRTEDRSLCSRCDWADVCLPDLLANGGVDFLQNSDLEEKLKRRDELKSLAKEYEELDGEIKETVKATGPGEKVVGQYLLNVKERTTKRKVPITFNEVESKYFVVNISNLQTNGSSDNE